MQHALNKGSPNKSSITEFSIPSKRKILHKSPTNWSKLQMKLARSSHRQEQKNFRDEKQPFCSDAAKPVSLEEEKELTNYLEQLQSPFFSDATKPVSLEEAQELTNYLKRLQKYFKSGSWPTSGEKLDAKYLPKLIKFANSSKPGLNLKFAENPSHLYKLIEHAKENRQESVRFIVNMGEWIEGGLGFHFAVYDYRLINGKVSVISLDPVGRISVGSVLLADRVKKVLSSIPDITLSIFDMSIQNSPYECGIFSLSLAKKLHKEHESLTRIHELNIRQEIPFAEDFFKFCDPDKYLPPSFYKHTQSKKRLKSYLSLNQNASTAKVNKKNQTLTERQQSHLRKGTILKKSEEGEIKQITKQVVDSIQRKRIVELKKLLPRK